MSKCHSHAKLSKVGGSTMRMQRAEYAVCFPMNEIGFPAYGDESICIKVLEG
jgi:hypothetical protein